jgi:hypothetical protein
MTRASTSRGRAASPNQLSGWLHAEQLGTARAERARGRALQDLQADLAIDRHRALELYELRDQRGDGPVLLAAEAQVVSS